MNTPVTRSESCIAMRAADRGRRHSELGGRDHGSATHYPGYPLARPAAFMATPIALSPSSMNLAKPGPSAPLTPNPRLAMNSRNSAASLPFFRAAVIAPAMFAGNPLGAAKPRHAPVV